MAAVVLVTGRAPDDVVGLLGHDVDGGLAAYPGLDGLVVHGHYGLERWDAATGRTTAPHEHEGVSALRPELSTLVDETDGARLEDKGASLAVHTRGAGDPAALLEALRPRLEELAERHGLEAVPGRHVLELRPPGTDKGRALRAAVAEHGATSVLFAGDDVGDLPALAEVQRARDAGELAGLAVASASEETDEVARRADLVVDGPTGVVALLRAVVEALDA